MKRKIIIILAFIACMFLTSCCAPSDYSGYDAKPTPPKPQVEHFDVVKNTSNFMILKHRETGVMYMINYHGGIVIVVDEDGMPYVRK